MTTTNNFIPSSANLIINIPNIGNQSVKNVSELEAFKLNGNKNILAIK